MVLMVKKGSGNTISEFIKSKTDELEKKMAPHKRALADLFDIDNDALLRLVGRPDELKQYLRGKSFIEARESLLRNVHSNGILDRCEKTFAERSASGNIISTEEDRQKLFQMEGLLKSARSDFTSFVASLAYETAAHITEGAWHPQSEEAMTEKMPRIQIRLMSMYYELRDAAPSAIRNVLLLIPGVNGERATRLFELLGSKPKKAEIKEMEQVLWIAFREAFIGKPEEQVQNPQA